MNKIEETIIVNRVCNLCKHRTKPNKCDLHGSIRYDYFACKDFILIDYLKPKSDVVLPSVTCNRCGYHWH